MKEDVREVLEALAERASNTEWWMTCAWCAPQGDDRHAHDCLVVKAQRILSALDDEDGKAPDAHEPAFLAQVVLDEFDRARELLRVRDEWRLWLCQLALDIGVESPESKGDVEGDWLAWRDALSERVIELHRRSGS